MTDTPVTRLRELHRRCSCWGENCGGVRPNVDANSHCAKCIVTYPCDTIAALDALEAEAAKGLDLQRTVIDTQRAHIDGLELHNQVLEDMTANYAEGWNALQARIDAATELIRQALYERHNTYRLPSGGVERLCGAPLSASIDTCPNCAPYRAWLAGDKEAHGEL